MKPHLVDHHCARTAAFEIVAGPMRPPKHRVVLSRFPVKSAEATGSV